MKEKFLKELKSTLIFAMLLLCTVNVKSQTTMPEELNKNTVKDQLKYIEDHTIIYEKYRAIREDMFQKLKVNVSDTISLAFNRIAALNKKTLSLKQTIDSVKTELQTTKTNLDDVTRSKNSIKILGLELNKTAYNSVMWTIVAVLIILLAIGFLVFKRNFTVIINLKKELKDLKEEFEAYRKTTREAREKMSMAHFNELKKLRGE